MRSVADTLFDPLLCLLFLGSILSFVFLAIGIQRIFKLLGRKIGFLMAFAFSYFLVSVVLFILQLQSPPSEYFTIPLVLGPLVFSYPFGILGIVFTRCIHLESGKISFAVVILAGFLQWLFLAFLYQRWKSKGRK